MNNTFKTPTRQQKAPKLNSLIWRWKRFLSGCRSDKRRRVEHLYKILISMGLKYESTFPRQVFFADQIDVTNRHTQRLLKELKDNGLLRWRNRGYATCVYFLPEELFFEERKSFENLFPALKALGIFLLMSFNIASSTANVASTVLKTVKDKKSYIHIIREDSYGVKTAKNEIRSSNKKREVTNMSVSSRVRQLGAQLKLTDYGRLLFSCFDDDIIDTSYLDFRRHSSTVDDPMRWVWKRAQTLSKEGKRVINYKDRALKVEAAGFKPGDTLFLSSDRDSQPRFEEKKSKKDVESSPPPPSFKQTERHPNADKWLQSFPVPEHKLNT